MASRLATANAGHALEEGLTMDFVDPNDILDNDADYIHDKHLMDSLEKHVPVKGEMLKGGRRASISDITAVMKEKQEAKKNLERNGKHILANLDKMVHNLTLNRKQCQDLMEADQEEVDQLARELAIIKTKKERLQNECDERLRRSKKLEGALLALNSGLGNVVSEVKVLNRRHQKIEHIQTRSFIKQTNTGQRGYHFDRVSMLPKDLLPMSFRSVESNKMRASRSAHSLPLSPVKTGSKNALAWSQPNMGSCRPLVTSPSAPRTSFNPLNPRDVV
jgi:hypothetical protein